MLPRPYFEIDGVTLYHGDCRNILPELQSEAFEMVLTDPPYLVSYAGRSGGGGEVIEGDSAGWVRPVFSELSRVLKTDSLCLSFMVGCTPRPSSRRGSKSASSRAGSAGV